MAASTLDYLDSYCERASDAALWAEPLNAITNVFFIIAAVLAARALLKRHTLCNLHGAQCHTYDLWLLVVFLGSIGIGSFLWHVHPTGQTVLMDVIPITLFINLYLISALHRIFALGWGKLGLWFGLYWVLTIAAQIYLPPDLFHGTVMYLPTYATMIALTYGVWRRDRALGKIFAWVTTVWTASLIFRTVDLEVCASLPIGTHFLWHTLNAWVLWRLLMVLIRRN